MLGFVQVYILNHASQRPVFGAELQEALGAYGHHLSPGTLYPVLRSLETKGLLTSAPKVVDGKLRVYYSATQQGKEILKQAQVMARKLCNSLTD